MKRTIVFLIFSLFVLTFAHAQQSVTLSGSVPFSGTQSYNQIITLVGLPSGCVPTISGATITFTGCPQSLPVGVTVTCTPTSVALSATVTCSAAVTNAANLDVTWSSSAGIITTTGVLTVPATPGIVTVTAHSLQDSTKSGSAVITVIAPATPITVQSESTSVSSGKIVVQPTQDTNGGSKLMASLVGQTYDYTVNVSVAGTYTVSVRLCNLPTGTGTSTVHFEYPIGTDISGPLSLLNAAQWTTVSAAAGTTVTLPTGAQTIRMKVDSLASGLVQVNWFLLTPLGPPPSVKLMWNPATSSSVTGYNIYRGTVVGGPYVKINNANISAPPYIDTVVIPGGFYTYVATSIGDPTVYSPFESVYSNETAVKVP